MPLTATQIDELADELTDNLDDPTLQLYASDLGVDLPKLSVGAATLKQRALAFIHYMNGLLPPRDGELLELVRTRGNVRLRSVAAKLLTPSYFSPTADPHDAIVLGKTAFIARNDLRTKLREFTSPNPATTRVLVVRGDVPGGKSYTWEFLRHLAFASVGAQPFRHRLKNLGEKYTPRHLFEDVFRLLDLDRSVLPGLTDDPQLARMDALLTAFKGKVVSLQRRCWLVLDDLNDPGVTPAIREAALAIAQAVEELKPEYLWVALLGYNEPIVDEDLRYIAQDDAEYPTPAFAAMYLEAVSKISPRPLTSTRASEIANVLFTKYPKLDKAAMTKLTVCLERAGEKLRLGLQP